MLRGMAKKLSDKQRSEIGKVCGLFANGGTLPDIAKSENIPYCRVTNWISKYYFGLKDKGVIIVKESKI